MWGTSWKLCTTRHHHSRFTHMCYPNNAWRWAWNNPIDGLPPVWQGVTEVDCVPTVASTSHIWRFLGPRCRHQSSIPPICLEMYAPSSCYYLHDPNCPKTIYQNCCLCVKVRHWQCSCTSANWSRPKETWRLWGSVQQWSRTTREKWPRRRMHCVASEGHEPNESSCCWP